MNTQEELVIDKQEEVVKDIDKDEIASHQKEKGLAVPGEDWTKHKEMDYTYTMFDKIFRLSLGENANFSGALYNGDYSISLEQAQRQKNEFIAHSLNLVPGSRLLDLGCGWGGWLKFAKDMGVEGIGVNLSRGQVAACQENGLNVHLKDARYIKPEDFGTFDAVSAMGSLEHVCTIDKYLAGKQDQVYDDYFQHVYNLLPVGGRFYVQSMVHGKNKIPYEDFDINAPKDSAAYLLALLTKHNPDSWIPYGHEHIIRVANPYFKKVSYSSGRLDYVQTNKEWTKLYLKFSFQKYLIFLSLIPKYLTDKEFRFQLDLLRYRPNRKIFEKEIFDHARLVFEKI